MLDYFVNSFVITIPSTLFPLALAALAAYGFSCCSSPDATGCSSRSSRFRSFLAGGAGAADADVRHARH